MKRHRVRPPYAIYNRANSRSWGKINSSRADAETFRLELPVYQAAPRIYRMRKYMEVFTEGLAKARKYLIAADVDPIYQLQLMDPTVTRMEEALKGEQTTK